MYRAELCGFDKRHTLKSVCEAINTVHHMHRHILKMYPIIQYLRFFSIRGGSRNILCLNDVQLATMATLELVSIFYDGQKIFKQEMLKAVGSYMLTLLSLS